MRREELTAYLADNSFLKSKEIIEAFKKIDRADFVVDKEFAYEDYPLSIGYGQTISQPSTVAFMIELLSPLKGDRVLDVGSGSGWTTALLSEIAKARVIGIELIPELVDFGKKNIKKYNFKNTDIYQAENKLGYEKEAPFDKILVSASAEEVPEELIKQLKTGGIMVVPVLDAIYKVVKKSETEIEKQKFSGFVFVPLK